MQHIAVLRFDLVTEYRGNNRLGNESRPHLWLETVYIIPLKEVTWETKGRSIISKHFWVTLDGKPLFLGLNFRGGFDHLQLLMICKKYSSTLDNKHKEYINEFSKDEFDTIPKLKEEKNTLIQQLNNTEPLPIEQVMEIKDRIKEITNRYH